MLSDNIETAAGLTVLLFLRRIDFVEIVHTVICLALNFLEGRKNERMNEGMSKEGGGEVFSNLRAVGEGEDKQEQSRNANKR